MNTIKKSLKGLRRNRAVSPLVATLLLIAIAVSASVITYSWVMSMVGSQSQQAQTQIRIDMVTWDVDGNKFNITVRNTGSVPATIESIAIRENKAGTNWYVDELDTTGSQTTGGVEVGATIDRTWDEVDASAADLLKYETAYIIRVTVTTGFYYTYGTVTPEAP